MGALVFASMLLAWFVSPWWSLVAVAVSFDLMQAAFTRRSPVAILIRKAGAPVGRAYR